MFGSVLRAACVAAPALAAASGAIAQSVVAVQPGTVVIMTPGQPPRTVAANSPEAAGIERMFAARNAMMARAIAQMDQFFSARSGMMADWAVPFAPFPAFPRALEIAAGKNGVSVCQESISITYDGHGGKPVTKVSRSGNGCGPVRWMTPVPALSTPEFAPSRGPKILEVRDPSIAAPPAARHAT